MNGEEELPPMPDDVMDILAGARTIAAPPSEVRARLRARLAPQPIPPGGPGRASQATNPASWSKAPWWAVAAALLVGVGAGRLSAPAPKTIVQTIPIEVRSEPPATAPTAEVPAPMAAGTVANVPSAATALATNRTATNAVVATKATGNLAAERRLLAVARTALGRSNGADALASCNEHERQFPKGELAEEREAIAIQALVQSQRAGEARDRANRFRQSYPKSILLPAVLASTEGER